MELTEMGLYLFFTCVCDVVHPLRFSPLSMTECAPICGNQISSQSSMNDFSLTSA
jgi:hypothetical protein